MPVSQDTLLRLLLTHRAMVMGYITFLVRDGHLAEDVFQEVAITVLNKGKDLDREAGFPSWVRAIARFKALSALQQKQAAPQPISQAVLELLEDAWSADDQTPSALAAEALAECLRQLAPRSQRLIELRYVHRLSGKELAQTLSQPLNTVYVTLSRIYRTLASCVKQRLAQEGLSYG
jgi:RNA polymerase sigma-70 factor (ECF subfamily)